MIKTLTISLALFASLNLAWIYYEKNLPIQDESGEHWVLMCSAGEPVDVRSRVYIEVLLLVALIGVLSTRPRYMLLTALGFWGVLAVYIYWWQYIFKVAANQELPVAALPHVSYLWKGNVADLVIAFASVSLVLYHVANALKSFFRNEDPWN